MLWWWLGGCVLNLTGATVIDEPFDRLELTVRRAHVDIRPVEQELSSIGFEFVGLAEPDVRAEVVDGVLHLQDPCGDSELCTGSLDLLLPADVDIRAAIEEGSLRVMSMRGEVVADVGGPITVRRHTGAVVDVVSTGGLGMELEFDATPDRVVGLLAEGQLDATVPAGAYRLELQATGMVAVDEGVEDDSESPSELLLTAESGSIRLHAR